MTLREIKTIDMDKTDFESEEKFQYCKGLQEGAEVAERAMKHRASHFVEVALQQIQKKHGIELNVEGYLKNLIYMMEWNDENCKGDYPPTDKKYDAEMIRRAQRYVGALIDKINEGYPEIKLDAHGILMNLEYDMQEDDQGLESRACAFRFGRTIANKSDDDNVDWTIPSAEKNAADKPKFKVGDCLTRQGYEDCVVKNIYDDVTYVCENEEGETHISVDEQDLWTLKND